MLTVNLIRPRSAIQSGSFVTDLACKRIAGASPNDAAITCPDVSSRLL